MRIIHTIIGMLITFIGLALLSITMDVAIRNIMVKVYAIILMSIGCFILKKLRNWVKNSFVKELVPSIDKVLIGIADTYASVGDKVYGYFPFY